MRQRKATAPNRMANFSLIMGATSIFSIINVINATIFGCLGLVFASLSRGDSYKMQPRAVGGFVTSLIGIVGSALLTIFSYYVVIQLFGVETALDPEALLEAVSEFYNQMMTEAQSGGVL